MQPPFQHEWALFELSPDAIVIASPEGEVAYVNEKALRLFGYSEAELLGSPIEVLLPERYRTRHVSLRQAFQAQDLARPMGAGRELWGRRHDGSEFPVDIMVHPVETSAGACALAAIRDVSDRVRTEAKLRRAMEAAEAASRAKSAFLANMSHELRTPLNAIIGYSEMLQEEAMDAGQESWVSDLDKISSAGRHLLALIDDILDLSKIEAGRVDLLPERFPVAEFVESICQTVQPLCATNRNRLTVACADHLGEMNTDRTRLGQCLLNLLSNAAKFTREGEVRLEVFPESTPHESATDGEELDRLCFRVSDSGIGMSEEVLDRIFHEFVQADSSTTRTYGGTGLGLAITRRLVLLLEGEVTATSKPGVGSVFMLSVPCRHEAAPLPPSATVEPGSA